MRWWIAHTLAITITIQGIHEKIRKIFLFLYLFFNERVALVWSTWNDVNIVCQYQHDTLMGYHVCTYNYHQGAQVTKDILAPIYIYISSGCSSHKALLGSKLHNRVFYNTVVFSWPWQSKNECQIWYNIIHIIWMEMYVSLFEDNMVQCTNEFFDSISVETFFFSNMGSSFLPPWKMIME